MDTFKEFEGKSLDDAIREACNYYNTSREKLEIDIIQDSKSGIFGLVGARKAKVRARRVQLRATVDSILGRSSQSASSLANELLNNDEDAPEEKTSENNKKRAHQDRMPDSENRDRKYRESENRKENKPAKPDSYKHKPQKAEAKGKKNAPPPDKNTQIAEKTSYTQEKNAYNQERAANITEKPYAAAEKNEKREHPRFKEKRENNAQASARENEAAPAINEFLDEIEHEGLPTLQLDNVDLDKLCELCVNTVERLVMPITGKVPLSAELIDGRINVSIDCGDDSGLLIGREGQTLASLQFLASRIVSQTMGSIVRVQLDAGEYRLRQYEKLRELALSLAEKVKATGKSFSTRPMSSYHRRIIHMTLQDSHEVQTRSTGEGPLKRVVVQKRKF